MHASNESLLFQDFQLVEAKSYKQNHTVYLCFLSPANLNYFILNQ